MGKHFIAYSALIHAVAFLVANLFFDFGEGLGIQGRGRSDGVSRAEMLRAVAGLNRLARIHKSIQKEESDSPDLAIRYKNLDTKMDLEEVLDQAKALGNKIDSEYYSILREHLGDETVDLVADWNADESKHDFSLESRRQAPVSEEIEALGLAASRRESELRKLKAGEVESEPLYVDEPEIYQFEGVDGVNLIDTISYENSVPSRFLELGEIQGLWSHVDSWYVIGPFAGVDDARFGYSDLTLFRMDLDYTGNDLRGGSSKWEYRRTEGPILHLGDRGGHGVYFAYSELYSDRERTVCVSIQSGGTALVWINGTRTMESGDFGEGKNSRRKFQLVTLNRGYNRLLVRVENPGDYAYLWFAHSSSLAALIEEEKLKPTGRHILIEF